MALRTDTSTGGSGSDALWRNTSTPSSTTWSGSLWFYRENDSATTYEIICTMRNTNYTIWSGLYISGNALTWSDTNGDSGGSAIAEDTWYHLSWAKSSGSVTVWLNGTQDINITGRPNPTVNGIALGNVGNFGSPTSEHFDGRFAAIKIWDNVALSQVEMQNEARSYIVSRPNNLFYANHCLLNSGNDISGNGNNFTIEGALLLEDGPPIGWSRRRLRGQGLSAASPPESPPVHIYAPFMMTSR